MESPPGLGGLPPQGLLVPWSVRASARMSPHSKYAHAQVGE